MMRALLIPIRLLLRLLGVVKTLSLALLVLAIGTIAVAIAGLIRDLDTPLMLAVSLPALFAGWGLADRRISGWAAAPLCVLAGLAVVLLQVGRIGVTLGSLAGSLASLDLQLTGCPYACTVDYRRVLLDAHELAQSLSVVATRTADWVYGLATGRPSIDPVAVAVAWSSALCAVSLWAGWSLRRYAQPLWSLTPACVLLLALLGYVLASPFVVVPIAAATLLLVVLLSHYRRERSWVLSGIDFSPEIRTDMGITMVPLVLLLVVASAFMPEVSVQRMIELGNRLFTPSSTSEGLTEELPVADSLGFEYVPRPTPLLRQYRSPGLPRDHLLKLSFAALQTPALTVRVSEPPVDPARPRPYYWRMLTFDLYTGSSWATSATVPGEYQAGQAVRPAAPFEQRIVQQVEVQLRDGGPLFATGTLYTAADSFQVAWRGNDDAFGAVIPGQRYQVESLLPNVTEEQLRAAGQSYPPWVLERYLQLPDRLPDRVKALARDLTATAATPYDRVKALERYLRETYPYSTELPYPPPPGEDIADHFLFSVRQGFCDYYATALIVMARAMGIPARYVMGYSSGSYDPATGAYHVLEANAHSWPEVYFPGYGWIEFEPTANQPLRRGEGAQGVVPTVTPGPNVPNLPLQHVPFQQRLLEALLLLALLPLLLGLLWLLVDGVRLRLIGPSSVAATLQRRLLAYGRRLGLSPAPGLTSYEYAELLSGYLSRGASSDGPPRSALDRDLRALADFYVRVSYSPGSLDAAARSQALQAWSRVRGRLWVALLRQVLGVVPAALRREVASLSRRRSGPRTPVQSQK